MDNDYERRSNNLTKCYQNYQIKTKKVEELTKVVNVLKEELTFSNNTITHYKKLIDTFNKAESITVLYNALRIKSTEIHNENGELKQRLHLLEESSAQEKQKIINECEDRITKLKAKYVQENETLTNELNKKIDCYESEIADLKKTLEIKETYMDNQIQLCQASADLQVDEAEIKWKTLLDSVNQKLKESNSTCINLRNQIIIQRNSIASFKDEINQHVQEKKEAEDKLVFTENQLISAQEKLLQNQHSTVQKYTRSKQKYSNPRMSTYRVKENVGNTSREYIDHASQSNNSTKVSNTSVSYETLCPSKEKTLNYENLHAVQGLYKTKHNLRLLQPCSGNKEYNTKKRKLFNPDSVEYLTEMENQD